MLQPHPQLLVAHTHASVALQCKEYVGGPTGILTLAPLTDMDDANRIALRCVQCSSLSIRHILTRVFVPSYMMRFGIECSRIAQEAAELWVAQGKWREEYLSRMLRKHDEENVARRKCTFSSSWYPNLRLCVGVCSASWVWRHDERTRTQPSKLHTWRASISCLPSLAVCLRHTAPACGFRPPENEQALV